MFRIFLFFLFLFLVESWIPLTIIHKNKVKTSIFIQNKEYFIDKQYNVYNGNHEQLKTKIENNIIWFQENSTNSMISQIRERKDIPIFFEIPYSWNTLFYSLFLSIPYSFTEKEYSTKELQTHIDEMNEKKLTIFFEDKIENKIINGKIEFFSPYLYKLSLRKENRWEIQQSLFILPIKKKKTRIILYNGKKDDFMYYLKNRKKKYTKTIYLKVILKWLKKYNPTIS